MKTFFRTLFAAASVLAASASAQAVNWTYVGNAPWVYNADDSQWYFMASIDDAVWLFPNFPAGQVTLLSPAQGAAAVTLDGRTFEVLIGDLEAAYTLEDGLYTEEVVGGSSTTGIYTYTRVNGTTAYLTLLEDGEDGRISVYVLTYTDVTDGTLTVDTASIISSGSFEGVFSLSE